MKLAIIGIGKMGRWFTKFFTEEGYSVVVSDKNEEILEKVKQEFNVKGTNIIKNAVKNVDIVLICVTLKDLENVLQEIQNNIKEKQIVMDISSLKVMSVELMHKYLKKGLILGAHPIFGPGAQNIKNQNFIFTPINSEEKSFAKKFKNWLEKKGAKVHIMTPEKHDELMAVVLGFPHFLGFVICDTLLNRDNYCEIKKVSGSTYKLLLALAEVVVSEESELYTDLQINLSDKDRELFLNKATEWLNLIKNKDKIALKTKIEKMKNRLKKIDPEYLKSYNLMYKIVESYRK